MKKVEVTAQEASLPGFVTKRSSLVGVIYLSVVRRTPVVSMRLRPKTAQRRVAHLLSEQGAPKLHTTAVPQRRNTCACFRTPFGDRCDALSRSGNELDFLHIRTSFGLLYVKHKHHQPRQVCLLRAYDSGPAIERTAHWRPWIAR